MSVNATGLGAVSAVCPILLGIRRQAARRLRRVSLRRAHLRWQIGLEADVRSHPTIPTVL
jgi:hypothetical protein